MADDMPEASPHLILSKPDWISESPGTDVLKTMFRLPFVTFWQVTADLPFAADVPAGRPGSPPGNWPASGRSSRPTATDHDVLHSLISSDTTAAATRMICM